MALRKKKHRFQKLKRQMNKLKEQSILRALRGETRIMGYKKRRVIAKGKYVGNKNVSQK